MSEPRVDIVIADNRIVMTLAAIGLVLFAGHGIAMLLKFGLGHDVALGFVSLFDLDREQNIPTLFSTLLLLLGALLCAVQWRLDERSQSTRGCWFLLTGVFTFLAVDEAVSLHELLASIILKYWSPPDILNFAWVIPYGVAVVLLSFFVIPVFWRFGGTIRLLAVVSASVYLTGALGLEMVASADYVRMGYMKGARFALLATFEEMLEIAGLLLFIKTMFLIVKKNKLSLCLRFT